MDDQYVSASQLPALRLGIDTYKDPVVYIRADSHVCRSEGYEARSRIRVSLGARSVIATLNVVQSDLLPRSAAGLSEETWRALGAHEGDSISLSHPDPVESFSGVRAKIYGEDFRSAQIEDVVRDIVAGRYSELEVAAFVTTCAGERMSELETVSLTRAMARSGAHLNWPQPIVADKHCVGGLPGNRTTPIVVAIAAACGLTIPKTSSRAITSPSGTADTMEVLAPVDLTLQHMTQVVEREGGCVVWGGAMALSPADDLLIRVERALDFDSPAQMAASILSKKMAAGSTHLLIDMPVGDTAKIRSAAAADKMTRLLTHVGSAVGLKVRVLHTDGRQPVGRGIGPALEARDILAVLKCQPDAPADLRERSAELAGSLLEFCGKSKPGLGGLAARAMLDTGAAWKKFQAICEAQGGLREPVASAYRKDFAAAQSGTISSCDNRQLAKAAKLAGAPRAKSAGIEMHVRLGDSVDKGQPCFTLHSESPGELEYAAAYLAEHDAAVRVQPLD